MNAILDDGKFHQTTRDLKKGDWSKWTAPQKNDTKLRAKKIEDLFGETKQVDGMKSAISDLFLGHLALGNEGKVTIEEFTTERNKMMNEMEKNNQGGNFQIRVN